MTNIEPKVADAGRDLQVIGHPSQHPAQMVAGWKDESQVPQNRQPQGYRGRRNQESVEGCPMMKAYVKAKQLTAKWEQERKESKRLATMKEAERRIQVREFDNMLCLSLDGIPVLPMSEFNKQTLADARLTFFNYLNRQ